MVFVTLETICVLFGTLDLYTMKGNTHPFPGPSRECIGLDLFSLLRVGACEEWGQVVIASQRTGPRKGEGQASWSLSVQLRGGGVR